MIWTIIHIIDIALWIIIAGSVAYVFFFALATPDYLVDEMWDKTFLRSPFVTLWGKLYTYLKPNKNRK